MTDEKGTRTGLVRVLFYQKLDRLAKQPLPAMFNEINTADRGKCHEHGHRLIEGAAGISQALHGEDQ
jgi:hypothetical protein